MVAGIGEQERLFERPVCIRLSQPCNSPNRCSQTSWILG